MSKIIVRVEWDGSYGLFGEGCDAIYFARVPTKEIAKKIQEAVNSHDNLVGMISIASEVIEGLTRERDGLFEEVKRYREEKREEATT
jgi:hypothetical protein